MWAGPGGRSLVGDTHLALQDQDLLSAAPPGPRRGQELLHVHILPNLTGQNLDAQRGSSLQPPQAPQKQGWARGAPENPAFTHTRPQPLILD